MKNNIVLRPLYYACVSGGKDSLYMLSIILKNPEKYPLDLVVNYDLEIEYEISKSVVNEIEKICKIHNIKFMRIKPRKSFDDLAEKYGYPSYNSRWCNSKYKLDCIAQLKQFVKSLECKPVAYIGFCADEEKRFKYKIGEWKNGNFCYPLAEENITEQEILEWARKKDIFKGFYNFFDRMGCRGCPLAPRREWAYLLHTEPEYYAYVLNILKKTEQYYLDCGKSYKFNNYSVNDFDNCIRNKWLPKLLKELKERGM